MKNTQPSVANSCYSQDYYPATGIYAPPTEISDEHTSAKLDEIGIGSLLNVPHPTVVDLSDGSQIRLYNVTPRGDYDESRTIVYVPEFAGGMVPHRYAAALAIAEVLGYGVIVAPHNELSTTRQERAQLRAGNVGFIAARQAEALDKVLPVGQDTTIYGYSFGAQIAPDLSGEVSRHGVLDHKKLALLEPPNTIERNKYQLLRDFMASGTEQWLQATRDSGWQALNELVDSNYVHDDAQRFMRQARNLASLAMIGAMQRDTFTQDLANACVALPPEYRVVVAQEAASTMVSSFALPDTIDYLNNGWPQSSTQRELVVISSTNPETSVGHAIGNNPMIPISLLRKIIE